jgi:hypothetical protein
VRWAAGRIETRGCAEAVGALGAAGIRLRRSPVIDDGSGGWESKRDVGASGGAVGGLLARGEDTFVPAFGDDTAPTLVGGVVSETGPAPTAGAGALEAGRELAAGAGALEAGRELAAGAGALETGGALAAILVVSLDTGGGSMLAAGSAETLAPRDGEGLLDLLEPVPPVLGAAEEGTEDFGTPDFFGEDMARHFAGTRPSGSTTPVSS